MFLTPLSNPEECELWYFRQSDLALFTYITVQFYLLLKKWMYSKVLIFHWKFWGGCFGFSFGFPPPLFFSFWFVLWVFLCVLFFFSNSAIYQYIPVQYLALRCFMFLAVTTWLHRYFYLFISDDKKHVRIIHKSHTMKFWLFCQLQAWKHSEIVSMFKI